MKKPKILFIQTLNAATVFHRIYQFLPYLRKEFDVAFFDHWDPKLQTTCYWESKLRTDEKLIKTFTALLNNTQLVVMQKIHTPEGLSLVKLIRGHTKIPLLMETDDYFLGVNSDSPAFEVYKPGADASYWALEQMRLSNGIITSTKYLAKLYERFNGSIYVIPNGIDLKSFKGGDRNIRHTQSKCNLERPGASVPPLLGWCGSCTHTSDLEILIPIIEHFKDVRFYFWGGLPEFIKGENVTVDTEWVSIDQYFKKLRSLKFDIGLAPIRDNEFNRAKSNLRWLEYSALGIPTVASNVEPYRRTTALLANNKEGWIRHLEKLIKNSNYRKELGARSYKTIETYFDTPVVTKKYAETLRRFL